MLRRVEARWWIEARRSCETSAEAIETGQHEHEGVQDG